MGFGPGTFSPGGTGLLGLGCGIGMLPGMLPGLGFGIGMLPGMLPGLGCGIGMLPGFGRGIGMLPSFGRGGPFGFGIGMPLRYLGSPAGETPSKLNFLLSAAIASHKS